MHQKKRSSPEKNKNLVFLTGAGMSADSGLSTFRGSGGLWEGHNITDVASPEAWERNPGLVLDFYNQRRKQANSVNPNKGHILLSSLQSEYNVQIITQNVDDLHERAGSETVLHLHGNLFEKRSSRTEDHIMNERGDIVLGDLAKDGSQFRPNIVWFGEAVPLIREAAILCSKADVFVIIGTSLVVYPAAGLIDYVGHKVPKCLIDPEIPARGHIPHLTTIQKRVEKGIDDLVRFLNSI